MTRTESPRFPIFTSRLIRYRLPRGIVVLLLAAVAIVVGTAYVYLSGALLTVAGGRAQTASRRLAASLSESARQLRLDEGRLVADTTIQRLLTAGDSQTVTAARTAAKQLLTPRLTRAVVAVKIVDRAHHDVVAIGAWPSRIAPLPGVIASADTMADLHVGPFQADADTVYYATSFPIRSGGEVVGAVLELRRLSQPGSAKVMQDLIGSGASLLIGDSSGAVWTDLDRVATGPVIAASDSVIGQYRAANGTDRVGASAHIARTPWVAWVEFPSRSILAPARRFLLMIGGFGLLVICVGGIGAWIFSRRIATPLEEVSRAAEGIAAGDLSQRVASHGSDELGRLASSFNSMAGQVEDGHRDLERRVAQRTAELETALAELSTAQEVLMRKERLATLGQLAGSVGHELRNPLGVMTNSLYLLSMVAPDEPPLLREYLGIIKDQVVLSEKIVGDLLDFARVKQPSTERFALKSVVEEQLKRAGSLANVTVSCDEVADVPDAVGDRVQIGQIVLNLLTNAVQAVGDEAGSVTVRCRLDAGQRLRLDVTDTGCGIPPANIERVFDPLFTTKARGIGLGLSVSRQLARVNGGDIGVASTVGIGSTFSLYLPVAKAAA